MQDLRPRRPVALLRRWCATLLVLALASRRDDDELGRLEPEVESKSFSFLLPEPQAPGVR